MLIIGVTGYTCTGKGTLIKYLEQITSYPVHSLSDVLREELKNKGKDVTRENLVNLGNELRLKHGHGVLAKKIVEKIDSNAIVDAVKNPEEARELKKSYGKNFVLINVTANMKTRFERVKIRGRENDPKTWKEFLELEKKHSGQKGSHSQVIHECEALADHVINNESSLQELESKIKALISFLQ